MGFLPLDFQLYLYSGHEKSLSVPFHQLQWLYYLQEKYHYLQVPPCAKENALTRSRNSLFDMIPFLVAFLK